jgi:hypothetical protein
MNTIPNVLYAHKVGNEWYIVENLKERMQAEIASIRPVSRA